MCGGAFFCFFSWQDTETGEDSERWISRKEKSLGLLCHKFLARYPDYPNPAKNNDICLDDVATELSMSSVQAENDQTRFSFTSEVNGRLKNPCKIPKT